MRTEHVACVDGTLLPRTAGSKLTPTRRLTSGTDEFASHGLSREVRGQTIVLDPPSNSNFGRLLRRCFTAPTIFFAQRKCWRALSAFRRPPSDPTVHGHREKIRGMGNQRTTKTLYRYQSCQSSPSFTSRSPLRMLHTARRFEFEGTIPKDLSLSLKS